MLQALSLSACGSLHTACSCVRFQRERSPSSPRYSPPSSRAQNGREGETRKRERGWRRRNIVRHSPLVPLPTHSLETLPALESRRAWWAMKKRTHTHTRARARNVESRLNDRAPWTFQRIRSKKHKHSACSIIYTTQPCSTTSPFICSSKDRSIGGWNASLQTSRRTSLFLGEKLVRKMFSIAPVCVSSMEG